MEDWVEGSAIEYWQRSEHLIIGQEPGRANGWPRLARIAGCSLEELKDTCQFTNLNVVQGLYFDADEANARATELRMNHLWRFKTVLCSGARVTQLMGGRINRLTRPVLRTCMWGIVHPSTTNRSLSDRARMADHQQTIRAWWSVVSQDGPGGV